MLTTIDLDPEKLSRASEMLKALAHPMRIRIIKHLEEKGKLTVTEIHQFFNIEQSTTSHHLGILRNKGVLSSIRKGKNTYYFIKHEKLGNVIDSIALCSCD